MQIPALSLKYQWQSRKNANSNWSNSGQTGAKTTTLSVATTNGLDGWQFRCIVTDANGSSVESDIVSLSIIDLPVILQYFPDDSFRQFVLDNFDKDKNGSLSKAEIDSISRIAYFPDQYQNISSMKGIEFFTSLTELDIQSLEKLTTLDLSRNKALEEIWVSYCGVTSIILGDKPNLVTLYCSENQITGLDLSGAHTDVIGTDIGVSPAFNVDRSMVVLSSLVSGKQGYPGANYKLTLQDNNITLGMQPNKMLSLFGSEGAYGIQIPFTLSGTNASKVTNISVLILDKEYKPGNTNNAKVLLYRDAYSGGADGIPVSGYATVHLPADLPLGSMNRTYFVYTVVLFGVWLVSRNVRVRAEGR